MTDTVLQITNLSVALPKGADRSHAIEHISLSIQRGKTLCVVGESGSGKSVMATAVMGLLAKELKADQGEILLQGEALLKVPQTRLRELRGQAMGMVFQEPLTFQPGATSWLKGACSSVNTQAMFCTLLCFWCPLCWL